MIIELRIEGNNRVHYLKSESDKWLEYNEQGNYCGFSYDNVGLAISRVFSFLHEMELMDIKAKHFTIFDFSDTEF